MLQVPHHPFRDGHSDVVWSRRHASRKHLAKHIFLWDVVTLYTSQAVKVLICRVIAVDNPLSSTNIPRAASRVHKDRTDIAELQPRMGNLLLGELNLEIIGLWRINQRGTKTLRCRNLRCITLVLLFGLLVFAVAPLPNACTEKRHLLQSALNFLFKAHRLELEGKQRGLRLNHLCCRA